MDDAPDLLGLGQVAGDDLAEFLGVEVGLEEVEVERLAQALGAGVAGAAAGVHPGLGDGGARRVVLVEDLAPFNVDLVDFVAVPERVRAVVETVGAAARRAEFHLGEQRFGEVLGQGVRHVYAEAVHAAVGPEAQGLEEVVADFAVGPVQVRLLLGEDVHVPLPGGAVRFGDAFPGGAAEDGFPVRGRNFAVLALAIPEDVALPGGGALRRGEGLLEPDVLVGRVVRDDVRDQLDAGACRAADISSKSARVPSLGSTSR